MSTGRMHHGRRLCKNIRFANGTQRRNLSIQNYRDGVRRYTEARMIEFDDYPARKPMGKLAISIILLVLFIPVALIALPVLLLCAICVALMMLDDWITGKNLED